MTPARPCPECGSPLAPDAPGGLCPRCLVRQGLALLSTEERAAGLPRTQVMPSTATPNPPAAPPRPRFGDYELIEEIAQGGMGVVYRARQISLNRTVALKMILSGQLATSVEVERFRTEAAAAARLDHPHIVPIYEIGEHEAQHFFTMKLVEGGSLAELNAKCGERNAEWMRRAAGLVAAIARAVHFAHQHGILHRDLKPTNILLNERGEPQLTDFGLAKIAEQDTRLTQSRTVMGSANYMSPEQARGQSRELTTAADTYSLGAILYELLTGRPPFRGESFVETLRAVSETDPVRPSALNTEVDRDLETICLKCLEKSPLHRYPSAEALALDLERWIHGEPIVARPARTWERTVKWARRKPAIAALLALVAVVGLAGLAGVIWEWRRAEQKAIAEAQQRQIAQTTAQTLRRNLYTADVNLAQRALTENNLGRAVALLEKYSARPGEEDLRGFEWRYLWKQTRGEELLSLPHDDFVETVAFSPDGRLLAATSRELTVRVWDSVLGRPVTVLRGISDQIRRGAMQFSPDGRFLVARTETLVCVWEVATWQPAFQSKEIKFPVVFTPDGKTLVAKSADNTDAVISLDTATWQFKGRNEEAFLRAGSYRATSLNGQFIATAQPDDQIEHLQLWDASTQLLLHELPCMTEQAKVWAVSSDGRFLAAGDWRGTLKLWDLRGSYEVAAWPAHTSPIYGLGFSPDSRTLASGGFDQVIHLWNVNTQTRTGTLRGHQSEVWGVAFSPDGQRLASASKDGTAKLWHVATRTEDTTLTNALHPLRFLADGAQLLTVSVGHTIDVWDVVTRRLVEERLAEPAGAGVIAIDCSSDGAWIALGTKSGRVVVRSRQDAGRTHAWQAHSNAVSWVRFSPDARWVASASSGSVRVWDRAGGQQRARLEAAGPIAFSPDGKRLVTAGRDWTAILWDTATFQPMATLPGHQWTVYDAAFSPDSTLLATASIDASARLWRADTGELVTVLRGHKEGITCLAFSPDGRTLATGSTDDTVKLWSVATHQEMMTLPDFGEDIGEVLFSPDGRTLAVGCFSGTDGRKPVQLWHAPTLAEIDSPSASQGPAQPASREHVHAPK